MRLPLCSVNTFNAIFFASFGTLDLLIRLARNEDPAPNVPPIGTELLVVAQFAADKFAAFALWPVVIPVAMGLQWFAPLLSFTCWAPIFASIQCGNTDYAVLVCCLDWLFSWYRFSRSTCLTFFDLRLIKFTKCTEMPSKYDSFSMRCG